MRSLFLTVFCSMLITSALFAQTTLYRETFDGGSPENYWAPGFNGNTMEAHAMPDNPSGDGWVGRLGNDMSGGMVGQSFSGGTFSSFYMEAQVYIPVDEGTYYGIEFRTDTTGLTAGYQFVARFKPGGMVTPRLRFRVRPVDNPTMPAVLRDWDDSEVPGGIPTEGGWHKLAVLMNGHSFYFYFDGVELPGCPMQDWSFMTGAIGAYVWDASSTSINLFIDDINITDKLTDISEPAGLPSGIELLPNTPNPFNPSTVIRYRLPRREHIRLTIHTLQGRLVATLADGSMLAGTHAVRWDASGLSSGFYIARLGTNRTIVQQKMLLMK